MNKSMVMMMALVLGGAVFVFWCFGTFVCGHLASAWVQSQACHVLGVA